MPPKTRSANRSSESEEEKERASPTASAHEALKVTKRALAEALADAQRLRPTEPGPSRIVESPRPPAALHVPNYMENRPRSTSEGASPTYPTSYQQTNVPFRRKSPVAQWQIKFSGRPRTLQAEEFLYRAEIRAYDEGVPLTELVRNVSALLTDRAEDWFWTQFRRGYPSPSWNDFRTRLLEHFGGQTSDYETIKEMLETKQGSSPYDEYAGKMIALYNRLTNPMPPAELVRIIARNLNSTLGPVILGSTYDDIRQLREACIRFESWKKANLAEQRPAPRVHELDVPLYYEPPAERPTEWFNGYQYPVEEVKHHVPSKPPVQCWNCHQEGHIFVECPSPARNVFCYRCGRPDAFTPTCPNCSGNRRTGAKPRWSPRPN